MNIDDLQLDYRKHEPQARAFLSEFLHQFSPLVERSGVKLGVPLEGRVKEWSSLAGKLDRKSLSLESCKDLPDLIGVRAITLFSRDVSTLCRLIEKTFVVRSKEDKATALDHGHFGYLSRHFVVALPKSWKKVPAFSGLDYCVEVQVRTLSQHIWAAASHLLQYKKESDVPADVARSIHRVAALLETVDLEFERVLDEREQYSRSARATAAVTPLDADNLTLILDEGLPAANKSGNEIYSDLLTDLVAFGVQTVEALRGLIKNRLDEAMDSEKKEVAKRRIQKSSTGTTAERIAKGVFYSHVGLARQLLAAEFGKKWETYIMHRSPALRRAAKGANKAPEPTTTAVTAPAAQEPRQP